MSKNWKWRIATAVILVAVFWFAHAPVLRWLAKGLITDQPPGDFNAICIFSWGMAGCDPIMFDAVGNLHDQSPNSEVFLLESFPSRLHEIRVVEPFSKIASRELARRGVPESSISIFHTGNWDFTGIARSLGNRLSERANTKIVVLCSEFHSGQLRAAIDASLNPSVAACIRVQAIAHPQYDATNWWKSRAGYRAFGHCWLTRFQYWLCDAAPSPSQKNADEYEKDFLENLRERAK